MSYSRIFGWILFGELHPTQSKRSTQLTTRFEEEKPTMQEFKQHSRANIGYGWEYCLHVSTKAIESECLHHKEEKEMTKFFHINIHVKTTKVDALFNSSSHANLIVDDLVSKLGLEVHDHPSPYPLGWVNKDANIKVIK